MKAALARWDAPMLVVDIDDPEGPARRAAGRVALRRRCWPKAIPRSRGRARATNGTALALLYTSGTTGDPKGVVYHHRGAYLNALGNALAFRLAPGQRLPVDAADVPLQRLDLHVGGDGGRRRRTYACGASSPRAVFRAIRDHRVTHLCGAPIVLNLLIHAPADGEGVASTMRSTWRPAARRRRRR